MRATLAILALAVIAAGLWAAAPRPDPEARRAEAEAAERRAAALSGIRRLLAEPGGLELSDAVISRNAITGEWEFRGLVSMAFGRRPAYGVLVAECATDLARPECWRIARVEIDGAPADPLTGGAPADDVAAILAPAGNGAPSGQETAPQPSSHAAAAEPAEPEPAAGPEPDPSVASAPVAPGPAPAPPEAAQPAPAAGPVYAVTAPALNARSGPGTEFPVVGVLRQGDRVQLLEESGAWGRFQVAEGNGEGADVWAAMAFMSRVAE